MATDTEKQEQGKEVEVRKGSAPGTSSTNS